MSMDPISSLRQGAQPASANAEETAPKSVASHSESTLTSASLKSDGSFDCLTCVKYYVSAAFNGIYSLCDFIYNLLFGAKVAPEKPKAEEKPEGKQQQVTREEQPKRATPLAREDSLTLSPTSVTESVMPATPAVQTPVAAEPAPVTEPVTPVAASEVEEEPPAPVREKVPGDPRIVKILQDNYVEHLPKAIEKIRANPKEAQSAITVLSASIAAYDARGSAEARTYSEKSGILSGILTLSLFVAKGECDAQFLINMLQEMPAPAAIFEMPAVAAETTLPREDVKEEEQPVASNVAPAVVAAAPAQAEPAAVAQPAPEPVTRVVEVPVGNAAVAKTQLVRQQSTEIVVQRLLLLQANFEAAKQFALAKIAEGTEDASDIATQFLDRIAQGEESKDKEKQLKGTKEHNQYTAKFALDVRQAANNREEQSDVARLQALKAKIEEIPSPQTVFAAQWPKAKYDVQVIAQLQANVAAAKSAALTKIKSGQEKAVAIAAAFLKQVMTEAVKDKAEAHKYSEDVLTPFFFAINDSNDLAILRTRLQTMTTPEDYFKFQTLKG